MTKTNKVFLHTKEEMLQRFFGVLLMADHAVKIDPKFISSIRNIIEVSLDGTESAVEIMEKQKEKIKTLEKHLDEIKIRCNDLELEIFKSKSRLRENISVKDWLETNSDKISVRLCNGLRKNYLDLTFNELDKKPDNDFLKIPFFGRKSLNEFRLLIENMKEFINE